MRIRHLTTRNGSIFFIFIFLAFIVLNFVFPLSLGQTTTPSHFHKRLRTVEFPCLLPHSFHLESALSPVSVSQCSSIVLVQPVVVSWSQNNGLETLDMGTVTTLKLEMESWELWLMMAWKGELWPSSWYEGKLVDVEKLVRKWRPNGRFPLGKAKATEEELRKVLE